MILWKFPYAIFSSSSSLIPLPRRISKNAGIFDGDLIVVRRQPTANNGEIVVAGVDGDLATAKKLEIRGGKYYLVPCSDETDDYGNPFEEIDLQEHEHWEIFGKVLWSIHQPKARRW